jgi:predicted dehydrogenase
MKKQIKIGIFGAFRGQAFMDALRNVDGAGVWAVCDKDPERIEESKPKCPDDTIFCSDYDELLNTGIDAVILCNYFHEHAPYAIRAMEKGIDVLSETMAASTLAECVALCRAVERTGRKYMMAENYPFMLCCHELKHVFDRGNLGAVVYSEGEYVHSMSMAERAKYRPFANHWRNRLPRVYYNSHALAPICYITGALPVSVTAMVASTKYDAEDVENDQDRVGIMLCRMSDGSISRTTGCAGMAPDGNWYRIGCVKGGIESVRGDESSVRVAYHPYSTPEGQKTSEIYKAQWRTNAEEAEKAGHGGGDFWVCYHFVKCLQGEEVPFFNVYRACNLAAVGILAWKGVLAGKGETYEIPDFADESQRKLLENDHFSPFYYEDGRKPMAPASLKEAGMLFYKK